MLNHIHRYIFWYCLTILIFWVGIDTYFLDSSNNHSSNNHSSNNHFANTITFITALFVLGVYLLQKREEKINAANILLLEIKAAEEGLDKLKEMQQRLSNHNHRPYIPKLILPINSWSLYRHLFIDELDQDSLELITKFYNIADEIQKCINREKEYRLISDNAKMQAIQDQLAQFAAESAKGPEKDKEKWDKYQTFRKAFLNICEREPYAYASYETIYMINDYLRVIRYITNTACGEKLKKIARK